MSQCKCHLDTIGLELQQISLNIVVPLVCHAASCTPVDSMAVRPKKHHSCNLNSVLSMADKLTKFQVSSSPRLFWLISATLRPQLLATSYAVYVCPSFFCRPIGPHFASFTQHHHCSGSMVTFTSLQTAFSSFSLLLDSLQLA